MRQIGKTVKRLMSMALLVSVVAACGGDDGGRAVRPDEFGRLETRRADEKRDTVFGEGGLFFGDSNRQQEGGGAGIGVNSYLWRASLDTVSFMPISTADPFGGVIITDWHAPPETQNDRFKLNVYILSRALRSDGIRVTAFRQTRAGGSDWVERPVDPGVVTNLENAILLRARQLRNEAANQ